MKWLNGYRMRLMFVGFVAAIVIGDGNAKADFTFGTPVNLGSAVNSSYNDNGPCISADGLSLYFDSDRSGGYGNPVWQPAEGKIDGALEFDGIDDYANASFVLNPSDGSFSVFAWIKGGTPGQVIIAQTDGAGFGGTWLGANQTDGTLVTNLMYFELASESVITDDQWHHVGIVWDGSRRCLYVDEKEVAKDTSDVTAIKSTGDLYIGTGKNLEAASFFSGLIDDVRICNRVVSP